MSDITAVGNMEWLLENGGPVIRYRTTTELLDDPGLIDSDRLQRDLVQCPTVGTWLGRLGTSRELSYGSRHLHFPPIIFAGTAEWLLGFGRAYGS